MPGRVLPPTSFGACAIVGARLTAASKTRVAPASNRLFISVLRDIEREFGPVDPAPIFLRTAVSPFDGGYSSIAATPKKTGSKVILFQCEGGRIPALAAFVAYPHRAVQSSRWRDVRKLSTTKSATSLPNR
jgi:hypothetical protein